MAGWGPDNGAGVHALEGSMAVLCLACSRDSSRTALERAAADVKGNRHIEPPIAPIRKNGLRRPQRGLHVLSDSAPIIGWMRRPVIGPARLRIGSSDGLACRKVKIGLTAGCCIPKLYWLPEQPKFMSRI